MTLSDWLAKATFKSACWVYFYRRRFRHRLLLCFDDEYNRQYEELSLKVMNALTLAFEILLTPHLLLLDIFTQVLIVSLNLALFSSLAPGVFFCFLFYAVTWRIICWD